MHCLLEGLENTLNPKLFPVIQTRSCGGMWKPPDVALSLSVMAQKMAKQSRVWDFFFPLSDSESQKITCVSCAVLDVIILKVYYYLLILQILQGSWLIGYSFFPVNTNSVIELHKDLEIT